MKIPAFIPCDNAQRYAVMTLKLRFALVASLRRAIGLIDIFYWFWMALTLLNESWAVIFWWSIWQLSFCFKKRLWETNLYILVCPMKASSPFLFVIVITAIWPLWKSQPLQQDSPIFSFQKHGSILAFSYLPWLTPSSVIPWSCARHSRFILSYHCACAASSSAVVKNLKRSQQSSRIWICDRVFPTP